MTNEDLILRNQILILEALLYLVNPSYLNKTPRLLGEQLLSAVVESESVVEAKRFLTMEKK